MFSKFKIKVAAATAFALMAAGAVYASHSWGNYHWARAQNPFTLKLGDNVSAAWDNYLAEASYDWSQSSALDAAMVQSGKNPKTCKATKGRVEVCNSKYGFNGWLGVATVWLNNDHITQGTVKLNDSYFNTASYDTPAWRRLVMCQEIGHQFGLSHQDENFYNPNLGTCMDYTDNPAGPPSNEHPNAHDYEQLETIYNGHLDAAVAAAQKVLKGTGNETDDAEWGRGVKKDSKGRTSLYVRDLGNNEKMLTFVVWAN